MKTFQIPCSGNNICRGFDENHQCNDKSSARHTCKFGRFCVNYNHLGRIEAFIYYKKKHHLNMRKIRFPGISTLTFVSSLVRQFCKTPRYCHKPWTNHLGKHYSPVLISSHQWRHQRNTPCSSSGTLGRFCLFQLWLRFYIFSKLDLVPWLIQSQPIEEWQGRQER